MEPSALIFFFTVGAGISLCKALEPRWGHVHMGLHLTLCSLTGVFMVLSASALFKFLIQFVTGDFDSIFSPVPWACGGVMGLCTVWQLKHLNLAMANFEASQVAPVYYVLFTISSITGAGIVNHDFQAFTPRNAAGFAASCAICFAGVALVTRTTAHDFVEFEDEPDIAGVQLVHHDDTAAATPGPGTASPGSAGESPATPAISVMTPVTPQPRGRTPPGLRYGLDAEGQTPGGRSPGGLRPPGGIRSPGGRSPAGERVLH